MKLARAILTDITVKNSDLDDVKLAHTNLHRATFIGVEMCGAALFGADLSRATLQQVKLCDANFGGIEVDNVRFMKVVGFSEEMERELKQGGAQIDK